MAQGVTGGPSGPWGPLGRWGWVALAVAVATAVTVGAALLIKPSTGRQPLGESPTSTSAVTGTAGSGSSRPASGSVVATGGAGGSAGTSGTASGGSSGGGAGGGSSTTRVRPKVPGKDTLASLKAGEWRLYGAQVTAPGTVLRSANGVDITGIEIECEAIAKAGGGSYGHGSFRIGYSASGPASGKGPWQLYGSWVLIPDGTSTDKRHYIDGIGGSMSGRTTTAARPPASGDRVLAGLTPIGAYRPKKGAIESGAFTGNSQFEGVLSLPGIPAPPASSL
jgi:hypothetical protein